jgi:hypothetical protein
MNEPNQSCLASCPKCDPRLSVTLHWYASKRDLITTVAKLIIMILKLRNTSIRFYSVVLKWKVGAINSHFPIDACCCGRRVVFRTTDVHKYINVRRTYTLCKRNVGRTGFHTYYARGRPFSTSIRPLSQIPFHRIIIPPLWLHQQEQSSTLFLLPLLLHYHQYHVATTTATTAGAFLDVFASTSPGIERQARHLCRNRSDPRGTTVP